MIHFTSDLHHSHKNICKYTNRLVETTEDQHSDWLIRIWNSQVKMDDAIYHLGDLSFASRYNDVADFVNKLNGYKVLIKGNHDKVEFLKRLKEDKLIVDWHDYKEIKIKGNSTVLFHFPIACWHKQGYGAWHLHGHSHGMYPSKGKSLDVGLDSSYNEFKIHRFFSEDDIEDYMNAKETVVQDGHKAR